MSTKNLQYRVETSACLAVVIGSETNARKPLSKKPLLTKPQMKIRSIIETSTIINLCKWTLEARRYRVTN